MGVQQADWIAEILRPKFTLTIASGDEERFRAEFSNPEYDASGSRLMVNSITWIRIEQTSNNERHRNDIVNDLRKIPTPAAKIAAS